MGGRVGQGVPAAAGARGSKTGETRNRLLLPGTQGTPASRHALRDAQHAASEAIRACTQQDRVQLVSLKCKGRHVADR